MICPSEGDDAAAAAARPVVVVRQSQEFQAISVADINTRRFVFLVLYSMHSQGFLEYCFGGAIFFSPLSSRCAISFLLSLQIRFV